MTTTPSPCLTDREKRLHAADNGRHAASAQAFMRLGLLLEYDEDSPAPMSLTHTAEAGRVTETLWGCAALPSAGDEAGCAAVDRFAARHHVTAEWQDGRYRAVIVLGGGYRYGAFYLPERNLHPLPAPAAREDAAKAQPELAVA
jgi:hypothetical protein